MLFFTILIYSLVGVILGSLFGIITLLIQHIFKGLKGPWSLIHFSMAFCISLIIFLYVLLFFLKETLYVNSPILTFTNVSLFFFSITTLFLLPFFFQWMDRKGRLFISYLSLLPSLWIVTSLKLNRGKELLPSILQINAFSRIFLLILGSILCFFLVYYFLSMSRRFFNRWKGISLLKPAFIGLSFIVLLLCLSLFLRKEGYQNNRNEIKNVPIGKPNIILITMDATRPDHLSCYGYERLTTPNLDKFSQEGVIYKNAYATAPWTLPSHASMFTGMYPTKHGAHHDFNPPQSGKDLSETQNEKYSDFQNLFLRNIFKLSEGNYTLAEILSERGYRTAGIIGGLFCHSIYGLAQGFDYYNDKIFTNVNKDISFFIIYQGVNLFFPLNDFITQYGYHIKRIASQLNRLVFKWLKENHEQPFFLFVHCMDAHAPYIPPPPYDEYFGKRDKGIIMNFAPKGDLSYVTAELNLGFSVMGGKHRLTPEERELVVFRYDGGIRYLDHCLGLLFEKLKALKAYDKTLIIVTSDHGEAFGEHNQMYHGLTIYEEILRVPLIIKYPSPSSRRGVVEKRVSLVDLLPTILAFLNYPIPSGIDGKVLENSDHPVIAERDTCASRAIYQGRDKYIWTSNSLHELYDLERDPREEENLITRFPHKAEAMERTLNEWSASFTPPKTRGDEVKISKTTDEALRALGYIG
jgi:arylsulfatase A-like enzyme